jgi:cell division inhibitor SepF
MGLFDKLRGYNEEEQEYDAGSYGYDDEPETYGEPSDNLSSQNSTPSYNTAPVGGMALNGTIELKVVKPENFESVPQIADHLINKRTVVLNLEATNRETARRLIDFLSGVAYSIDGNIKRVANNTYVITPSNVDISGDQMKKSTTAAEEAKNEEPASPNFYNDEN